MPERRHMNSERFTELLNRYLDDTATGAEREELMQLLREGSYDEVLKERIHTLLLDDHALEEMDPHSARKIMEGIIANGRQGVIPIRRGSRAWPWIAAAAVLMVTTSVGWWISRTEQVPQQLLTLQEERPQPVVYSGKQFVRLPDGSTVLLNEDTKVSYAPSFGERDREVTLTGEGYFDVRHDPSKPFKVVTGSVTTTVLGTAFNVKAYPDQDEIKVTVTRGKVKVDGPDRTFGTITPDQQIAVNTVTNEFIQTNLESETVKAWQSQYLILDDMSLEEAAKTIGEKYKVKITLSNDDLKTCRITATFLNGEDLDQVLTVVTGVIHATYVMRQDGNVIIEGKGCK